MRKVLYRFHKYDNFTEKGWLHNFTMHDGSELSISTGEQKTIYAIVETIDKRIISVHVDNIQFVGYPDWDAPYGRAEIKEPLYQVKPEDLIGDIKDFPIEVVQKMVERQLEQTGRCDVKVFQKSCTYELNHGGFSKADSEEGKGFWIMVLYDKNFDYFFSKYPKP